MYAFTITQISDMIRMEIRTYKKPFSSSGHDYLLGKSNPKSEELVPVAYTSSRFPESTTSQRTEEMHIFIEQANHLRMKPQTVKMNHQLPESPKLSPSPPSPPKPVNERQEVEDKANVSHSPL